MIHMVMHQQLVGLTSRWYQERNDRRHPTLWSIDFSQRVTVRWNINGGSEGSMIASTLSQTLDPNCHLTCTAIRIRWYARGDARRKLRTNHLSKLKRPLTTQTQIRRCLSL